MCRKRPNENERYPQMLHTNALGANSQQKHKHAVSVTRSQNKVHEDFSLQGFSELETPVTSGSEFIFSSTYWARARAVLDTGVRIKLASNRSCSTQLLLTLAGEAMMILVQKHKDRLDKLAESLRKMKQATRVRNHSSDKTPVKSH